MYRPFMTDDALLESLEGQQYLVLRPELDVASYHEQAQTGLREGYPCPHTGHVTLRGFFEPERVNAVRDAVAQWASRQEPIELRVDGIDGFPPPFQILITRLQRSRSLVNAYGSLTSLLDCTDLHRIGELPLDEWVFHLSLAYANSLSQDAWHQLLTRHAETLPSGPTETIKAAEFVWYSDGEEHSEVIPLASHAAGTASTADSP